MKQFEMGGYLPLELHNGRNYFADLPESCVLEVNTGRTALWYAIQGLGVKKVLVPCYYCPDIIAMLEQMDIQTAYYRIGEDFLPLGIESDADTAVILVNYYGILGNQLLAFSKTLSKVIFDNAHAFYAPPVMEEGVMNVYSCRKFFGVSDGAYLIGKQIPKADLEQDVSSIRAGHLLKSMEMGTNAAYLENKQNEQELGKARLSMSILTKKILQGVDYADVAEKRKRNFQYLHEKLKPLQQLKISEAEAIPYMYPLLLDWSIHKELVRSHIYVPVLWSQLLEEKWNGTVEGRFSANIVPLPLDQRYDETHLDRMVEIIRSIVDSQRKKV